MSTPNDRDLLDFTAETALRLLQWLSGGLLAIGAFIVSRVWSAGSKVGQMQTQLTNIDEKLDTLRIENNDAHDKIGHRLQEHGEQIADNRARLETLTDSVSRLIPRLPWLKGQMKDKGE
jgi:hypothetical protein